MNIIKKAAIMCFRGAMSLIYAIMKKVIRPQNKVVFLSRQSDEPSRDFLLIAEQLKRQEPQVQLEFSCKLGLKRAMVLSYILLMLRQMAMLAGARACVTESYCPPISLLHHRDSLRVVQIWHSMVAIKQFGWHTVDRAEGTPSEMARLMRMHAGYDYIVTGSEYQRQFMAEAMNTPIEKVRALGQARADMLLRADRAQARAELEKLYPQTQGKRVIAYLPTMRRGRKVPMQDLAEAVPQDSILLAKLHPLDRWTSIADRLTAVGAELSTERLLCAADAVISDYSGAAAEAALMDIPVYFYTPDIEQYSEECGINIDPTQVFAKITATDAHELGKLMAQEYPKGEKAHLRGLLAGGCDGHSAEKIARLVLDGE